MFRNNLGTTELRWRWKKLALSRPPRKYSSLVLLCVWMRERKAQAITKLRK